jgi:diguanylate cyclase (GGDEF)-like protein/PAS domain S-box-containing protein
MQTAHDEMQGLKRDGVGAPGDESVAADDAAGTREEVAPPGKLTLFRPWLSPTMITYLMAPSALVAILLLMHFHVIVRRPAWEWVAVMAAVLAIGFGVNRLYRTRPTRVRLHLRIFVGAAAVTSVIYLSGWGPVLIVAYAIMALDSISQDGSEVWPIVTFWSLVAIVVGQVCIARGVLPSVLSEHQANAMAVMGTFVLVFVIRIAAAIMEKKEKAEASMRMSEDRFRSLIQNSSDTTLVMGTGGICTYASPAVSDLTGYTPDEVLGRRPLDYVHPDDRDRVRDYLGRRLQPARSTASVQFRMMRKDGSWCDAEAVVANQLDRPSVAGYVVNIRDITERKEFEALLAHRALHDSLTGLPNRQLLLDRAEQMLARARREIQPVAAFFIDLDNFKDANDSLGHEAGDRLLQAVAARFVTMLRASDTIGRMGGDEFVILAEGLSLAAGPEMVAERIREVLRKPFQIEGFKIPITVTASIGIATGDRQSAQELLRDADVALYRAKATGRDRSVVFEAAMQSAALDRLALRSDLESALERKQFFLVYQPIFDLDNVRIRGVEALLRWRHPTKGVVVPDGFIPALEDTGLIVPVGRWVLWEACRQVAAWRQQGYPITASVNVSMRQLETDQLVLDVRDALAASGLDAGSLTLEVTESTLMRDAEGTVARLRRLKNLGVMIAIDDFGTGYSSMAYLRQFPVDVLKIDRSFVAEVDGSADSAALIHTLVELGRTLGLVTLAEGIEDDVQLDRLRFERCDTGQGFIFSRPVEPSEIEALLTASACSSSGPPVSALSAGRAVGRGALRSRS